MMSSTVSLCPTSYWLPGSLAVGQACPWVSQAWTLGTEEGGAAPKQAWLKWQRQQWGSDTTGNEGKQPLSWQLD